MEMAERPRHRTRLTVRRDSDRRNAVRELEGGAGCRRVQRAVGPVGRPSSIRRTRCSRIGLPTLELRALNVDQEYYVAIESFDENGVSKPSGAVRLP